MHRLFCLVLMALLAKAQSIPSKRDVVDVFMECAKPDERDAFAKVVRSRLQGKPEALRFSSPTVVVPPTENQVTGNMPECTGNAGLDDQAKSYIVAIQSLGALADAFGAGGVGSAIATFLNGALAKLGLFQSHQTNANCAPVCALVPGDKNALTGMKTTLLFWNTQDDYPQNRSDDFGWDNWSHFEGIRPYPTSVKLRSRMFGEPATCDTTLVCTQLRNWSHNRTRQAQIIVDLPINNVSASCSDYSVVNRSLYEDVLYIEAKERKALEYYKYVVDKGTCPVH